MAIYGLLPFVCNVPFKLCVGSIISDFYLGNDVFIGNDVGYEFRKLVAGGYGVCLFAWWTGRNRKNRKKRQIIIKWNWK